MVCRAKVAFFVQVCVWTLVTQLGFAQEGIRVRRYFDDETALIKEEFTVRDTLTNVLEGPFTAYFSNGREEMQGAYQNNRQEGHWKFYYENGNIRMEGDYRGGESVGKWQYYYERQGTLSAEGVIFGGMRQETWVEYYESGQPKSEGKYLDGKRVGIWNYFYEDGTLKAQAFYRSGKGIYEEYFASGKVKARGLNVNGRSDSTWQFFFESGEVQSEGGYEDGIRKGPWTFYYANGQVKAQGDYVEGQPDGKWNYYYEDGTLNSEGALQMGHKEGFWKIYDRSGAYKAEGVFQDGEGEYREYYPSGKLRAVGEMRDDQNNGQWYYYYEDGELEGECFFVEGRGEYIGYYPDSTIKTRGLIEDGKWVGEWQLFAEDGKLEAYYRPVYPDDTPIFSSPAAVPPTPSVRREGYGNPEFRFREQRFTYFQPKPNEYVGVIIGGNPLMFPLGWIPLSAEIFFEERLGYELEVGYTKRPFFTPLDRQPEDLIRQGAYLGVRQKFYHQDGNWGMMYFGHELRYTYLNYNQTINNIDVGGDGFRAEYYVLGGSRFLVRTFDGFTIDVYGALGVGYNGVPNGVVLDRTIEIPRNLSIQPWLGINAGWMFSAKSRSLSRGQ